MTLAKYLLRKVVWYAVALLVAVFLNFLLPRLVPGNPVDAIVAQLMRGGSGVEGEQMQTIYQHYMAEFGLNEPMWKQFIIYVQNLLHGDLGTSFSLYPAKVAPLISQALPWSIAIQLPAVLIGWLVGNVLGALAAYKGGWLDSGAFIGSLFLTSMPYYCLAILLLYLLAVTVEILPTGGGYSFGLTPELTPAFIADALHYYWLPFLSLVLIFIGGQAVGMRSMAIYENNSDYVNYSRGLGLADARITRYIFRNAMLPQLTGLALSIGGLVGGALVTELVFSYPGIGSVLFNAIGTSDYPVVQAVTLIIAVAVLVANFLVEVAYGFVDPRIRAAATGDR